VSVRVGRYGRVVLPKEIRDKYGVGEKSRLIVRERRGEIVLIPVARYERPTDALYGSVPIGAAIDEPKEVARKQLREKLIDRSLEQPRRSLRG